MNNIIGNGLLARSFSFSNLKRDDILIFASGVSNSLCNDASEFQRECDLLDYCIKNIARNKILIYFSTCSIYDSFQINSSLYIQHKIYMESKVKNNPKFIIFRLPQVVGFTDNPKTLTNFFKNAILNDDKLKIYKNASRNIIDIDDIVKIVLNVINDDIFHNQTINVANPKSDSVLSILNFMEEILQKKAIYELIRGGASYDIEVNLCSKIATNCNIIFDSFYTKQTLTKYYSSHKKHL